MHSYKAKTIEVMKLKTRSFLIVQIINIYFIPISHDLLEIILMMQHNSENWDD